VSDQERANGVGRGQLKGGPGKSAEAGSAKASPKSVIGRAGPRGRLNKRLILGVIASAVVGMLVLNFLPAGKKVKGSGDGADSVYANDSMPQDVKELAMRVSEVPVNSATSAHPTGYSRMSSVNNPFAGYPAGASETRAASARVASGPSAAGASKDYQGMAASDARLEAEKLARRAPMEVATKLTAGLTVGASSQSVSASPTAVSEPAAYAGSGAPVQVKAQPVPYTVGGAVPQVAYTPGEIYRDFNDQATKVEFSSQRAEAAAANVARPADPSLLPYTIFAGTIIPAALETAINTDLPGDVRATVAENVYDSVSGKNLLIPQGSKLLAKYSSNISFGQNRVQVAWQRLIRPDGVSLQLGNMNGVDPQGMSGYTGYVDEHWWQYAKGIGLMLLFSIIDGQLQYSMKQANTQGAADVANSLTAGIDQVGAQFIANAMNIQPTIIVKQGAKVQVFVNADIIMPAASQKAVSRKYSIQEGGTQ
jgi:type IV secretory pathway VirB10-like protein